MVRLQQGLGQKIDGNEMPGVEEEPARKAVEKDRGLGGPLIGTGGEKNSGSRRKEVKGKAKGLNKGKGKDWSFFDEELRPKDWDKEVDETLVERSESASVEDAEIIEMAVPKESKDMPKGEIEFGGALNEDARAEQDMRVAIAFGAQIIDLTGDD